MDNAKTIYVRSLQAVANQLADLLNTVEDLAKIYDHRLYGAGLVNEFTDAELAAVETAGGVRMTAEQILAFVVLCSQLTKFINGEVAAQQDYKSVLNRTRTDL